MKSTRRDKPTKAQRARMDAIREIGCIACRMRGHYTACEIHHFNLDGKAGQRCLGHDWTVGLCSHHHRNVPWMWHVNATAHCAILGPPLTSSRAFRAEFGDDATLLAYQNQLIAEHSP